MTMEELRREHFQAPDSLSLITMIFELYRLIWRGKALGPFSIDPLGGKEVKWPRCVQHLGHSSLGRGI